MTARRILLATAAAWPTGGPDDLRLAETLRESGAVASFAVWDDPAVRWTEADLVLIRSIWDYHRKPARFREWLLQLESIGATVANPVAAIRWNMDKRYLRDLAEHGIPIPPSRWLARGGRADLPALMRQAGWPRAVIKPTISAGARDTWIADAETLAPVPDEALTQPLDVSQGRLDRLMADYDFIVQPYLGVIASEGEWSLVYLGGAFSHAILKRPKQGDFRVQPQYGSSLQAVEAPPALRAMADHVLACVPHRLAYARVDLVMSPELGPLLMELEIIEPNLFLGYHPPAIADFARLMLA